MSHHTVLQVGQGRLVRSRGRKLASTLAVMATLLAGTSMVSAAANDPGFEWRPIEALPKELRDVQSKVTIMEAVHTKLPKPTADASKYTRVYTLELEKFGIRNDGTDAVATSNGINAALQHSKALDVNKIIFPKGTYLISENIPVTIDLKDTIIDLNGATLQMNTNGLTHYKTVDIIHGAENLRLTNGTLRGDKDTHDFKTNSGTHEGGHGLVVTGGKNLEIDHLLLTNMTGDGVGTETNMRNRRAYGGYYNLAVTNLKQGGFSAAGIAVEDTTRTRTIEPYDMSTFEGEFEIGYIYGYMCYQGVRGRDYQAYFYDENMKFVARKEFTQFKKNPIPAGAKFMHLEFNQPVVDRSKTENFAVAICNLRFPLDVHFHDNVMSFNRRQGLSFSGGQRWIIENNVFEDIGGTAPGYGIDLEDGWDIMQDIVIRNNTFRRNRGGDIVLCAGSELLLENNTMEKNLVVWGRAHNYTIKNNTVSGGVVSLKTRTGAAVITGNTFENCKVSVTYEHKDVDDGIYTLDDGPAGTPAVVLKGNKMTNIAELGGTYLILEDSILENVKMVVGKETQLVNIKNNTVKNVTLSYQNQGPAVEVNIGNNNGAIEQLGSKDRVINKK